jgi:cell division septum initiation protein DivIVA
MQVVEVQIGDGWYKAEQEVVDALQACNKTSTDLHKKLERLSNAVIELHVKEETAREHPTRDMRLEAWKAKRRLYDLFPHLKRGQLDLFR